MKKNTPLKTSNYYIYFCSLFTTIVIAGNIFALKFVKIGFLSTPAGMICFPFTYSLGDIITELYGFNAAKKVILMGLLNLIIYIILLNIVIWLPQSSDWPLNKEFDHLFSISLRIVLGTILGYLIGELINSKILSILKYITDGNIFLPRSIISTIIGVTVDTIIFNMVAFIAIIPLTKLMSFIFEQYILKLSFELFGSLMASIIVAYIRKREPLDIIDNYSYKWIDKYKKLYSETGVYFQN